MALVKDYFFAFFHLLHTSLGFFFVFEGKVWKQCLWSSSLRRERGTRILRACCAIQPPDCYDVFSDKTTSHKQPCMQNTHHICFNASKLRTGKDCLFYFPNRVKKMGYSQKQIHPITSFLLKLTKNNFPKLFKRWMFLQATTGCTTA